MMQRLLPSLLVAAGLFLLTNNGSAQQTKQLPPGFKADMDRAAKEASDELNGPKGDEARRICSRVAGVTVPAKTGRDIIAAGYSAETAIKWTDCVVNYMNPVDARKNDEYDRKAGVR
jgi:hypothetical protein